MYETVSGKLPPRKIAPQSGSGFGLGLALELGLGAIFLAGNFPGTVLNSYEIPQFKLVFQNNR